MLMEEMMTGGDIIKHWSAREEILLHIIFSVLEWLPLL